MRTQDFNLDGRSRFHGHVHGGRQHGHSLSANKISTDTVQTQSQVSVARGMTGDELLSSTLSSLDKSIAKLRSQLDALTAVAQGQLQATQTSATAAAASAQLITKEKGVLRIATLEGDEVTLRFSAKLAVDYQAASAADESGSVSTESLSVQSRSRVGISIEGDLNEDELAAVNDLVDQMIELSTDFFNGNVDDAFEQAANLDVDDSQLADVSLRLSFKQSFTMQQYAVKSLTPVVPTSDVATQAISQATQPVIDDPLPASQDAVSTPVPVVDTPVVAALVESLANTPADPTPTTPEELSSTAGSITSAASAPVETSAPQQSSAPATEPVTPAAVSAVATTSALVIAAFVAQSRERLQISATDQTLGFTAEFKMKLLMATISTRAMIEPTAA